MMPIIKSGLFPQEDSLGELYFLFSCHGILIFSSIILKKFSFYLACSILGEKSGTASDVCAFVDALEIIVSLKFENAEPAFL